MFLGFSDRISWILDSDFFGGDRRCCRIHGAGVVVRSSLVRGLPEYLDLYDIAGAKSEGVERRGTGIHLVQNVHASHRRFLEKHGFSSYSGLECDELRLEKGFPANAW